MTSTESTAAAELTDVLSAILNRHGATIVEDRRRLLGLLRDKAPVEMRPIRILMVAFDQGVPGRLKHATISEIDIGREVAHLTSEAGIAPDLARAAVLSWASALAGYKPATTAADTSPLPLPGAIASLPPVQPLSVQPLPANVLPSVLPLPPQAAPSVQPIPAAAAAMVQPLPAQPPSANVTPSVQPMPPQAAPSVQPIPTAPMPAPMVQPLPAQPLPTAAAATIPPQQDKWRILRLVLTGLIAVGAGAKVFDVLTHSNQPAVQQQPAPSTSPPAPSPQQTPPAQTAEGVSVLKTQEPLPHLRAGRVNNDPNSLMIYFGVPVGNSALSYQVNFIFTKNQERGVGFAAAFSGNQTATTGTIAADHYWKADTKEMSLILSGPMTTNPFNAPSICMLVHIGPRLDRIDIDSTSFAAVFGVKGSTAGSESCDAEKVIGFGYLQ